MKLVLATHNTGKLAEMRDLLAPLGFDLLAQSALGIASAPEPYCTFVENALAKARHAAQQSGLPALADDAGLCLEALNGQPGVQTADYCVQFGYQKSDANNVRAVLEQLATHSNRRATMVSTLVAVRHPQDPQPLVVVGRVQCEIASEPLGSHGFGFDPVLWLPELGQTFAQLTPELKNRLSHRGRAAQQMLQLLREHWL